MTGTTSLWECTVEVCRYLERISIALQKIEDRLADISAVMEVKK